MKNSNLIVKANKDRRNEQKQPTIADMADEIGFKPSGKEIKAAWDEVSKD